MPAWWSAVAARSHIWSSGLAHLLAERLLPSPHHPGLPPGSHLSILCSCEFDLFKILHMNGINGVLRFIFQLLVLMCRHPHDPCTLPCSPPPAGLTSWSCRPVSSCISCTAPPPLQAASVLLPVQSVHLVLVPAPPLH